MFNFGVGDNGTADSNCGMDVTIGTRTGSDIYLKCKYSNTSANEDNSFRNHIH